VFKTIAELVLAAKVCFMTEFTLVAKYSLRYIEEETCFVYLILWTEMIASLL